MGSYVTYDKRPRNHKNRNKAPEAWKNKQPTADTINIIVGGKTSVVGANNTPDSPQLSQGQILVRRKTLPSEQRIWKAYLFLTMIAGSINHHCHFRDKENSGG